MRAATVVNGMNMPGFIYKAWNIVRLVRVQTNELCNLNGRMSESNVRGNMVIDCWYLFLLLKERDSFVEEISAFPTFSTDTKPPWLRSVLYEWANQSILILFVSLLCAVGTDRHFTSCNCRFDIIHGKNNFQLSQKSGLLSHRCCRRRWRWNRAPPLGWGRPGRIPATGWSILLLPC